MKLSFIIPVYNGEHTVCPLFSAIRDACNKYNYSFEVIYVWDCGPDKSWDSIMILKKEFPSEVRAIRLSDNFGQHNAIICGFVHAHGEYMITMDEDLQHNPKDIKLLVDSQLENDYDVVYGYYPVPQHKWYRNLTSYVLRRILTLSISGIHKDYSAFRLLKKNIALAIVSMQDSYAFIDGYITWITNSVGSVKVSHSRRLKGDSSYSVKKLINHSVNILVTFSKLPVRIIVFLSFLFFVFTFGYTAWILLQKLLNSNLVSGFASLIVLTGLGIGLILLGISAVGEYFRRINLKTNGKPEFRISEIL